MKEILEYFFRLLLGVVSFLTTKAKKRETTNYEGCNILVYAYFGIGNMVFFTPSLVCLRQHFPDSKITLQIGNETGAEEVVAGAGVVDKIIEFNIKNSFWNSLLNAIRRMRDYDVIIAGYHARFPCILLQTAFSIASLKIGHVSGGGWESSYDFLYNFPVKVKEGEHEGRQYLRLLEGLGINSDWEKDKKKAFVYCSNEAKEELELFLKEHAISEKEKIICFQVGTSPTMRWKQWPLENFRDVIKRVSKNSGIKIVLVGAPNEREIIEKAVQGIEGVVITAGRISLSATNALIGKSCLVICNDSGLAKCAIAQGVKTVTIWGPTDFSRVGTWLDGHIDIRSNLDCIPCFKLNGMAEVEQCQRDYKCLKATTPEYVVKTIEEILNIRMN